MEAAAENELGADDTVSLLSDLKSRIKRHEQQISTTSQETRTPLATVGSTHQSLIHSLEREEEECARLPPTERQARLSAAYEKATQQIGSARTAEAARIWLRHTQLQACAPSRPNPWPAAPMAFWCSRHVFACVKCRTRLHP
jgi:hypothetical protein